MLATSLRTGQNQHADLIHLIRKPVACCCPFRKSFLRPFSVSSPDRANLPYFHKQLTKKDRLPVSGTMPNSLTPQVTPPPTPRSSAKPTASSSSATTAGTSQAPAISKRQAFKAITPSSHLMHEIRLQGLGSKAESWSFDKASSGNKTIRPWDKKLPPEEWKQLQKEKRLPPKQVWFEQRTSKVIEKEQVKFPGMRFVAGASSMKSVPKEDALLRMIRPDLFEDLEGIKKLLREAEGKTDDEDGSLTAGTVKGEEDVSTDTTARLQMSPEEIQRLRDQQRKKELEIKDSVLQEIAIVGRSNVGKSTMLNTLTESPNTARVSSKPGLTRQLNFYRCGEKFVVVDMPGYGFAFAKPEDKAAWTALIEEYLSSRRSLKRIYVMIDARHGLKVADKEFLSMLNSKSKKFQVVLTKCDLVAPPDLARTYMLVQEELKKSYRNAIADRLLMVSSYTGAGMNTLRKDMLFVCGQNILVRERERPKSTF
ncbi:hypothetical protein KVV02_000863 [Mortierella alpina]|uniref:EngB-type G domain-containing protein n=1 Tax=Mortierella alpina TaxID=64518 RepID=A0A9P8D286_MORAP|nr:hypothetical protein KVV02_000863 [Mortierella alpina]